jgi:hypothetical protein
VGVTDRPELREWRKQQTSPARKLVIYVLLGLIALAIFGLMLYFANR